MAQLLLVAEGIDTAPELQTTISSRQKLEAQKAENESVKKVRQSTSCDPDHVGAHRSQEFDHLEDGETVYKLLGPILLKQDKADAEATVKGRLGFIDKELYVRPYSCFLRCCLVLTLRRLADGWIRKLRRSRKSSRRSRAIFSGSKQEHNRGQQW